VIGQAVGISTLFCFSTRMFGWSLVDQGHLIAFFKRADKSNFPVRIAGHPGIGKMGPGSQGSLPSSYAVGPLRRTASPSSLLKNRVV